jgi:hypothetical protein
MSLQAVPQDRQRPDEPRHRACTLHAPLAPNLRVVQPEVLFAVEERQLHTPATAVARDHERRRGRRVGRYQGLVPPPAQGVAHQGLPIATEKKPTNLARSPNSTAFFLLETHLCRADSRNRIRERLSRTKNPGNHAVSSEGLEASRLPSFAITGLNNCHPEDRWFFLRCYRKPIVVGNPARVLCRRVRK